MMKIQGIYSTREVFVDDRPLLPNDSLKHANHSPDGFNWGYGGSGPSQLALAILLLVLPIRVALIWYQPFKWKFVAKLPESDFEVEIDPLDYIRGEEKSA